MKKGTLLDFLTTPSTPSKEFGQNPEVPPLPPPPPDFQLLCIYGFVKEVYFLLQRLHI